MAALHNKYTDHLSGTAGSWEHDALIVALDLEEASP
jgi:hypothetical protein